MNDLRQQKSADLVQATEYCILEANALLEVLSLGHRESLQPFLTLKARVDTAGQAATVQVAEYLERTKGRFVAAIPDLNSLLDGGGELGQAFRDLGDTIEVFRETVEASRDELEQSFHECTETLERVETLISECVGVETITLFETLLDQALERLEEALMDVADKAVAAVSDSLKDALTDFEGVAQDVVEDALGSLADIKDTMLDRVTKSGESVIEDEVSGLANDIVKKTLSSVLDDVAMTQVSAQVTAALSAQLPQLTAAKHAVGAVKRLLDIMRSGGV